ncbi:MAG TPA: hexameric tyrosine-coordinated heme protein [Candidatus Limnocylindria bacterium]|jgi:hypothetical protein|nr:hexameric tyrosine-coordinated heme protein [Candidatus Limnocylindria bacterium]
MQTNIALTEDLTAADPVEGMRMAEAIARRLAAQSAGTASTERDPAEYLRTSVPPIPDLTVLTAIQFGTIAAANNYWRKG